MTDTQRRFAGKVVFVAGGTSGLNLSIARGFADEGASVAVISRDPAKVAAAVDDLSRRGPAWGVSVDVRDADAVADAFAQVHDRWDTVDVVVSGAAGNFAAAAAELSPNGFRTVVDIDLIGTFTVLRSAWEHLTKPGSSIINISAGQSWLPVEQQVHACAAKAGIDQVTRTLALEWGSHGVRVNSIAPGPIAATEGVTRLGGGSNQVWVDGTPLGRMGTGDDIAEAALWLASPAASYITGVVLPVDGGFTLNGGGAMSAALRAAAGTNP